jgi:hypothetical protein
MSFEEKIMGGNKIENVLIISEAKMRLMSPLCIKVYVGNTPPNSSFNDDGTSFGRAQRIGALLTKKFRHCLPAICWRTLPSNDYWEDIFVWYFYYVWGELARSHLPSHSRHA